MRRVGILTEIFPEYHSPNKRNCRSLKASLRLVVYFPWLTVGFWVVLFFKTSSGGSIM